ncbi:MAG: hypothetical protein QOF31_3592 [Mycobacterium sp.]|jgi:hypothetical protein|nr:hypothetical protein [Mycobacterium sp.]
MTNKATTTPTEIPDAAQKLGEQLVSAVKQSQNLALDAARAFAGAWSSVPFSLSEIPNVAALPDAPTVTAYSFDLAAELLAAQKDFALTLATTLTPGKTA